MTPLKSSCFSVVSPPRRPTLAWPPAAPNLPLVRGFFRRAIEIYRAFLVTAVLMLVTSFVLRPFFGSAPNLATTDLDSFLATPFTAIADVLLLRRQPYLSSVLPMYAFFALAVPLVV